MATDSRGGRESPEPDYDCDLFIDCEEEEGLREVLHMLCSGGTPRRAASPRPAAAPRRPPQGDCLGLSSEGCSAAALQLPPPPRMPAPPVPLSRLALALAAPLRPPLALPGGGKPSLHRKRALAEDASLTRVPPPSYDIDLTPDSIQHPAPRARSSPRTARIPEMAPLSHLLSRPSLATLRAPLPCPFSDAAPVAGEQCSVRFAGSDSPKYAPIRPSRLALTLRRTPAERDSDSDPLSASTRGGARQHKSLQHLCRRFVARCALLSASGERVVLSISDLAEYLQVSSRRASDIVSILAAVRVLVPCKQPPRVQFEFCGAARATAFLGEVQSRAVGRHGAQAQRAGLVDSLCLEGARVGEAEGAEEGRGARVQEALCVGLVGLFLVGFDALTLQQAARLLGEPSEVKMKRLYDVANTLCGAGLLARAPLQSLSANASYSWAHSASPSQIRTAFLERSNAC